MVAITSPLFVRSYLTFQVDPVRGVLVLQPGDDYRWRSEGYATTRIGAMGMPGGLGVVPKKLPDEMRIAVWGDSQAEGVCVSDSDKLHQRIENRADQAGRSLSVLPMARSGDDLSDWLIQIPRVESRLKVDTHLLLIAEFSDLGIISSDVIDDAIAESSPVSLPPLTLRNRLVEACPAFLIQAIRRIVSDADETPRQLRFRVGPVTSDRSNTEFNQGTVSETVPPTIEHCQRIIHAMTESTRKQVILVYAPNIPIGLAAKQSDGVEEVWLQQLTIASETKKIIFIDMRETLRRSAEANRWPHGFHNGQFGVGHLNAVGYELIAKKIIETLPNRVAQ